MADDETKVNEVNGEKKAFVLSLADVTRLSGEGLGFSNFAQRVGPANRWWHLRTPGASGLAWIVNHAIAQGHLDGSNPTSSRFTSGGIRPALILHQAGT